MYINVILVLLFVATPLYILYRSRISGPSIVFNFCLYPLVFSYFYLLLPAVISVDDPVGVLLGVSTESALVVDLITAWTVFVFLCTYYFSSDRCVQINHSVRVAPFTLVMARIIRALLTVFMLLFFGLHGLELYAASSDRGVSYALYAALSETYRFPLAFSFLLVSCVICYVHSKKLINYAPLLLFVILDALVGGRGFTFGVACTLYLSHLTFNSANFYRVTAYLLVGILVVFASAFFRRYDFGSGINPVFSLFGEFYVTRLNAQFAIDYFNGVGDLMIYFLLVASKLLPQFLVSHLFDANDALNYAVVMNNQTGLTYGLAGSVVAEAVYYGGTSYAFFSPVLIAIVYSLMNGSNWMLKLPGFIFFILLTASTYNIFRSSFLMIWASLIYIMFYYFGVILIASANKTVFRAGR